MRSFSIIFGVVGLVSVALARDVPNNVRDFYKRVKNGKCTGGKVLQDDFYSKQNGPKTFAYCQDGETGVLYLHGEGSKLANMDIDCDGDQSDHGDGRCGNSDDTQSTTAFKDQVQKYSKLAGDQVTDLNANFIPYVVFGNYGSKKGYTNFDPKDYGLKPLSVMAVLCGDKLVYGVWGDTNGDDGPPLIGETSISLATECFGTGITGNNGHDQPDVLYIGFPGSVADTVVKKANWAAKKFDDFESTISAKGDSLIRQLS